MSNTHRRIVRALFVREATNMLLLKGLPAEIVELIIGVRDHAASVIQNAFHQMVNSNRDIRMSIRWFRTQMGLRDPVFVCNQSWHWIDPDDMYMSLIEEFIIISTWMQEGRPVPPYVPRAITSEMVVAAKKRHVHYRELHALRRKTGRARRALPRRWRVTASHFNTAIEIENTTDSD